MTYRRRRAEARTIEDGGRTLDRGLRILELLAERPQSVTELSDRLESARSNIYRSLMTLRRWNLVERDSRTGRYVLGFGVLRLARALHRRLTVRHLALGTMRDLAASVGETIVLTVRSGNFGVAVEAIESTDPVRVAPAAGERVPLHIGAPMKAILAFLPSEETAAYLERRLERLTRRTITDPRTLRRHLARIRERGYAESWEEVYPGAVGVAVPLIGHEGFAVGSLAIAGPIHRFTGDRVADIAHQLMPAGKEVSRKMQSVPQEMAES